MGEMWPQLPQSAFGAMQDAVILFDGGFDQETPAWSVDMGKIRQGQNYERSVEGGYQDIEGYERYDGRARPSDATYAILDVTITGSIVVGDTVDGVTSGDSGVVIAVVTSGAQDYLVLTKTTGTFNASEDLEVSAVVEGNTDNVARVGGAETSILDAQYTNLAADEYRTDIAVVPGAGNVLGVWMLNGDTYAFRNVVGNTAAKMFKDSSSGWTEVNLGLEIDFTSGGTYVIAEGDTITGATSGATATVERVIIQSGTFAGGDAAGYLILSGQTGTFQSENLDVGANLDVATIAGDSSAITLQPDGDYEFYNSNFANPGGGERMYGADGANLGFEFDGTVYVPIRTGMATDTPTHVIVHRSHLFFAFGSSLQNSGITTPYNWTLLTGANEVATDWPITGFQREPSSEGNAALFVATEQRLYILYGSSVSDFDLRPYRDEVGAYENTIQQMAQTLFLDAQGITMLRAAQEFGNFQHSTLSQHIQTYINGKRTQVAASCIVRDKNQYRLFFTDNTALFCTMEGTKVAAMMPCVLDHQVVCMVSEENTTTNTEEIYFGSTDGYVYQMERGTSFDGANIEANLRLHFTNDNVRTEKEFHHVATVEATGSGYAEVQFAYELGYGLSDVLQALEQTKEIQFSTNARWDAGLNWDAGLFWDGKTLAPTSDLDVRGRAENISFSIRKDSDYFKPVRLTGIHYRYSTRRRMRGR